MKKLPLFIIACLLVSVTTWAEWKEPEQNPAYPLAKNLIAQSSLPICCSADGKIVYVSYITPDNGFGKVILYKSVDGGETWAEQQFFPALNPKKNPKNPFRPEPESETKKGQWVP